MHSTCITTWDEKCTGIYYRYIFFRYIVGFLQPEQYFSYFLLNWSTFLDTYMKKKHSIFSFFIGWLVSRSQGNQLLVLLLLSLLHLLLDRSFCFWQSLLLLVGHLLFKDRNPKSTTYGDRKSPHFSKACSCRILRSCSQWWGWVGWGKRPLTGRRTPQIPGFFWRRNFI